MPRKDSEARRAYQRARYAEHSERLKKKQREYYAANRETVCRRQNERNVKIREQRNATAKVRYRESWRSGVLRRKYGLTEQQVEAIITTQGGGCAICGGTHLLGVDHDHATGKVRGILCRKCNSGIGQLDDDADRVRRAAAYLAKFLPDTGDEVPA